MVGGIFAIGIVIPLGLEKGFKSRQKELIRVLKIEENPIGVVFAKMQTFIEEQWKIKRDHVIFCVKVNSNSDWIKEDVEKYITYLFNNFDAGDAATTQDKDLRRSVGSAVSDIVKRLIAPEVAIEQWKLLMKCCVHYLDSSSFSPKKEGDQWILTEK